MIKIIKFYLQLLQFFSPKLSGKQAFEIFQITNKKTIRKREEEFYSSYSTIELKDEKESFPVITNKLKSKKKVVLVHGWNSNLASLQDIAHALDKEGVCFYAFNLPAHGKSSLKKTNIFACKERFKRVVECIDDQNDLSFICHSFGSAVTSYALSEMEVKSRNLVFLSVPEGVEMMFEELARMFSLNEKTMKEVTRIGEELTGEPLEDITTQKKLKKVDFEKLLLIHDRFDKIIPFENSKEINLSFKNSELVPFEKIGHYRMLTNKEVINESMKFILG